MRTNSLKVGDGEASEAGEEAEAPDLKSGPGPSPLSGDVLSTGDAKSNTEEAESKGAESTETEDESASRKIHMEPERTPTKSMAPVNGNVDDYGDLTEKISPPSMGKDPGQTRRPSGEAEAETGDV